MQTTLFGKKTIISVSYSEAEIIQACLDLHSKNGEIDVDPCYSTGNFYIDSGIEKPKYKFDKNPQIKNCIKATSDNLPLNDNSVNTVIFDPPFIFGKGNNAMIKRYTQFDSFDELKEMYKNSLKEFYRILKNNGIVIFKCQDMAWCGDNYFTHVFVFNIAIEIGLVPKDLFILLSKIRVNYKRKKQYHGRKYHSYFIVLKKQSRKIDLT